MSSLKREKYIKILVQVNEVNTSNVKMSTCLLACIGIHSVLLLVDDQSLFVF